MVIVVSITSNNTAANSTSTITATTTTTTTTATASVPSFFVFSHHGLLLATITCVDINFPFWLNLQEWSIWYQINMFNFSDIKGFENVHLVQPGWYKQSAAPELRPNSTKWNLEATKQWRHRKTTENLQYYYNYYCCCYYYHLIYW